VRAHLIQYDIVWEDPPENRKRISAMIESSEISAGDLIVLPEMYATGFSLKVETTADDEGADAAFLADLAKRTGAAVVGGITVRGPGKALNRALAFGPGGAELTRYDKIHPFSFGREHEVFTGGDRVATFGWDGLRVGLSICYDLRFPELYRELLAAGAEAMVVIANWPAERREHWMALARARAIENQAAVLAVNRTGADPHLRYAGDSRIISGTGETLASAGEAAAVVSAEVDPEAIRAWRETFPAWRDRRLGIARAEPS
jgi:predicted amidohydrolase